MDTVLTWEQLYHVILDLTSSMCYIIAPSRVDAEVLHDQHALHLQRGVVRHQGSAGSQVSVPTRYAE
jgi:hypothetical protein